MADNSDLVLDVKNLKTVFFTNSGLFKAVDDISFTVKHGETLAKSLFTSFVWAFEMTAVLLVIAVVGGVALARRSGQRPGPLPAASAEADGAERRS